MEALPFAILYGRLAFDIGLLSYSVWVVLSSWIPRVYFLSVTMWTLSVFGCCCGFMLYYWYLDRVASRNRVYWYWDRIHARIVFIDPGIGLHTTTVLIKIRIRLHAATVFVGGVWLWSLCIFHDYYSLRRNSYEVMCYFPCLLTCSIAFQLIFLPLFDIFLTLFFLLIIYTGIY